MVQIGCLCWVIWNLGEFLKKPTVYDCIRWVFVSESWGS